MYLFDTNAVIYFLSGDKKVVALVKEILKNNKTIYVPTIVRLELFSKSNLTLIEQNAIYDLALKGGYNEPEETTNNGTAYYLYKGKNYITITIRVVLRRIRVTWSAYYKVNIAILINIETKIFSNIHIRSV